MPRALKTGSGDEASLEFSRHCSAAGGRPLPRQWARLFVFAPFRRFFEASM
jgi:hypothetical protein